MTRLSPTTTYGLISMLILCLLLGAVTLPNATRWFQGSSAFIQQDVIILLGNDTTFKSSSVYGYHEWQYNKHLIAADNTPPPSESGLQGILYDRGLSCSPTANNTLPLPIHESAWRVNLSRIALVQLGGCLLSEKLEFAQNDGASAVIFYNNATDSSLITTTFATNSNTMDPSLDDNEWQTRMHIDPGTIFIPAYHVDDRTGQELYERLENLTSWETNNQILKQADDDHPLPPSHLVTRVTLYPDQKPFLEPWQFALIVIGVVVLTSLFIVLAVQCHLYRVKQRRHQEQHHHYEENDETDDQVNNESFWLQLLSAADNDDNYTRHHHQQQEKKPRYRLHPSVLDTLPTRQWDGLEMAKSDQCVICLEPFVVDDTLRTLPCEHEYHRDCIDVWLTKKNACCPLCLQLAITLPTIPEQVHHTHHHQNNSYTHEERLDHHHLWYDRTDQEDTPSSHTATTLTMPTRLSEVTSDPHQHQPPN